MSNWLTRHLQAFLFAVGRLVRSPFATVLTVLVIGIALALPASFTLLVGAVRTAGGDFANAVDVTVYFRHGTDLAKVRQLADSVRSRGGIDGLQVIPADEALQTLRNDAQLGAAIAALGDNPLPHAIDLRPSPSAANPAAMPSSTCCAASWSA